MMIKAKVKEDFNDKENKFKYRKKGTMFICSEERYQELYFKGFREEGKEIKEKNKEEEPKKEEGESSWLRARLIIG